MPTAATTFLPRRRVNDRAAASTTAPPGCLPRVLPAGQGIGEPAADVFGQLGNVEQAGHQVALEGSGPEDLADGDAMRRAVHHPNLVAGADIAGLEHAEIGAGPGG